LSTKLTESQMRKWDKDGNYPIHVAASDGKPRLVAQMLAAGADINGKGDHGMTPLMCAAKNGHSKVVKLMVNEGADLERKANGKTAFRLRAERIRPMGSRCRSGFPRLGLPW
jgi:ankyrin repeat protein